MVRQFILHPSSATALTKLQNMQYKNPETHLANGYQSVSWNGFGYWDLEPKGELP